jgi:histone acetyltransferase 1
LKITQKQVQRCYEILKLRFIDRTNEEEYKKYRLEVKKRLYKLNLEEMEGMGPDRRKALLETEYQELEANYQTILKHFTSKPNAKE